MSDKPRFKQTEIGMLPDDWVVERLGSCVDAIFCGRDPSGGKQSHSKKRTAYRIIQSAPVFDGYLDRSNIGYISEEMYCSLKSASLKEDDVLLNQLGDGITFARSCVVPKDVLPALITRSVGCIRCNAQKLDPWFLNAFLILPKTKNYIESFNSGSSRRAIDGGKMRSFLIPVPPICEQRRIGLFYKTVQEKIELNDQVNETLESIGRVIFRCWFVDFEFPNEEGKPYKSNGGSFIGSEGGKISMGWETGRLGDICEITMGQSPPGETYNEAEEGVPFFQGIRDFGFRFPSKRVYCTAATRFAKESDVLLSVRAPVGSLNIAQERCTIGRGVAAIRLKGKQNGFLYYLLLSTRSAWDKYESKGTVFGSATKQDVNDFQIVIPPKDLRDQFGELVEPLDKRILLNEKASRTLTAVRDSLLPRLMSGKIRVPVTKEKVEAS